MTCAAIKAALRRAAAAAILLALSLALALGGPHPGAEAQAQPELGDDGFVYPVLEEEDFQIFVRRMASVKAGGSEDAFDKENNVDAERAEAAAVKIIMNAQAIMSGSAGQIAEEFGPSILFNDSEKTLYAKYESQIQQSIVSVSNKIGIYSISPETMAQMQAAGANYVYPALGEEDFQLFVKIMGAINAGQDPVSFCGQNGADPARTQAVVFKIIVNLNAIITGDDKMLKTNFGPSIVFNGAELGFCDKYKDQIVAVLEAMQANLFGG
jgi:hypothetical protein